MLGVKSEIMNKKLALLALIPLVSFMLVPVVTATTKVTPESTGDWIYAYVACNSEPGYHSYAGASLTFGHNTPIVVLCAPGNEDVIHYAEWFATGMAKYTATVFAGGNHYTVSGKFGINNCGSSIYGKQENEVSVGVFDMAACFIPFSSTTSTE